MRNFVRAALIRAARTIAQTAASMIGVSALLSDVDWMAVLSASVLAGVLSVLTSIITDLPEAPKGGGSVE